MSSTKIYLVENCYGDPNKVYIGKTKESREKNHRKTYGFQIKYTFIDEIHSLNRKDWKPLECFWIEQFKQWGFEILNKNKGGGGPEFHSEYTKNEMKGKPKPKGFGENHSKLLKGITKPEGFGYKLSKINEKAFLKFKR